MNFLLKKYFSKKILAFIIAFQGFTTPQVAASTEFKSEDDAEIILNQISIDYLKKTPKFNYILGPGDNLEVVASRDYPELTTIVTIDNQGTIILPKLDRIYVSGLTIDELIPLLNKSFEEYLNFPLVEISIIKFRPLNIYVSGEVNSPGLKTIELNELNKKEYARSPTIPIPETFNTLKPNNSYLAPTIFDALKLSDGITSYSDMENVILIRKDIQSKGAGLIKTNLNLKKLLINGDFSHNINLYDGDKIIVKKLDKPDPDILSSAVLSDLNSRYVSVIVLGRVNNPGNITIFKTSSLNDAIDFAGGAKFLRGPIQYLSYNSDGTIDKRKFRYSKRTNAGDYKNPYLKNGDLVLVGNSPFSLTADVINEITSPFQGLYSTYRLIEAITND